MSSPRTLIALISAGLLLGACGATASGEAWMTDFDAALKKAASESKDVLVDFSGSDWCGWCIRLDEEVFSKDVFVAGVTNHFVPVVLDFPRKPENVEKIPEAERKRNDELRDQYGIRGYPTVLLMDAKGVVYGRTGYQQGGPEPYLESLAGLQADKAKREAMRTQLAGAEGAEKARLLDQLVQATPDDMVADLREEMKEIIALDPDHELDLRDKYSVRLGMLEAQGAMSKGEFEEAVKRYQSVLDQWKPAGEERQKILFAMGEPYFRLNQPDKVVECLKQALAADPASDMAEQLEQMIERFEAQPETP